MRERVHETRILDFHEISKNGRQEFYEIEKTRRDGGENGDANAHASFRIFSGEFNFLPVFATRGRFGIHSDFKFESVSDSDIRTDFTQFENIKQSVENVDAASFRRDFNFLGIVAE